MPLRLSPQNQNVSLSSSHFYSQLRTCKSISSYAVQQKLSFQRLSVSCSISKIHGYGTVDYERRPIVKWNDIYKRISLMKNPEMGSASVLNKWESKGQSLTKWDLCRVIKELRKYKRHERALEVKEKI